MFFPSNLRIFGVSYVILASLTFLLTLIWTLAVAPNTALSIYSSLSIAALLVQTAFFNIKQSVLRIRVYLIINALLTLALLIFTLIATSVSYNFKSFCPAELAGNGDSIPSDIRQLSVITRGTCAYFYIWMFLCTFPFSPVLISHHV